jgi:hypothetical protein
VKYVIVLDIEAKEDDSGVFPDSQEVRTRLRDVLQDATKHNETIGWRVTKVEGLRQTLPGFMW